MTDPALAELAAFCGIEPGYHDIWGTWRAASDEAVVALISALGVRIDGPGGASQAVQALLEERWSRALPDSVVVRRSDLGQGIALRLPVAPADGGGKTIEWRLTEEGGAIRDGLARVAELECAEECMVDGHLRRVVRLALPNVAHGYHRIALTLDGRALGEATLVVVPERCHLPVDAGQGRRWWGLSMQLYGLRSGSNWGIGDFGDLAQVASHWCANGAAFIGVNPLHALYSSNPEHASPYGPSSRLFLNPLYIAVPLVEEFADCAEARALAGSAAFAGRLDALRDGAMVDYAGVAAAKHAVLQLLYECFRARDPDHARVAAFAQFRTDGGEALQRYAVYEALHEHFHRLDASTGSWQQWPQAYRNPQSDAVRRFALGHEERIGYFLYLQWQAALQLQAANAACGEGGAAIGLYLDLAVSIDRGGADAWSRQDLYALGASVGAPPDDFNPDGQDWGLPPCRPQAMGRAGYASFVETLRANMASAGALRIDHVMGLARLFWLPLGGKGGDGAYVRYPLADLLGIIALESERHRCMVIGEDLGTVPEELRQALREWGVLSYRLLMFERGDGGSFNPAGVLPLQSLVAFSTHDLPTFVGYWRKQDRATRRSLLGALHAEGVLPVGIADGADLPPAELARLNHAVHLYLARSEALLLALQIDDLTGAAEQANLPGTPDRSPNWRRKLPVTVEAMHLDEALRAVAAGIGAARGATPDAITHDAGQTPGSTA